MFDLGLAQQGSLEKHMRSITPSRPKQSKGGGIVLFTSDSPNTDDWLGGEDGAKNEAGWPISGSRKPGETGGPSGSTAPDSLYVGSSGGASGGIVEAVSLLEET